VARQLPGPDADDRGSSSGAGDSGDLAIRAEQALLGAVMSDPVRQAAVLDVVRPDDMLRPYHGQVLGAMQRLGGRGVAPAPGPVRAELAASPDVPQRVALDGVLLADLLAAAPRQGHAPAYAAMVIDHSIRQQLWLTGSRITQAAEAGEVDAAVLMAVRGGRDVGECQARWDALPDSMRRPLPAAAGRRADQAEEAAWQLRAASEEIRRARDSAALGVPADLAGRLALIAGHVAGAAAASRPVRRVALGVPGEARPAGPAAEAAGRQFLRDLIAGPGQMDEIRRWLRPGHFARPAHGHLYALIRDMHAAGKPVDPLTAAWEAAHRGLAVDAAELEGGSAPLALAAARDVHRHGLLACISQAGSDISAAAGDPQFQLVVLLRDADQRLRRLELEPRPQAGRTSWPDGRSPPAGRTAAVRSPGLRPLPGKPRLSSPAHEGTVTAEPA
jgi:hypothetical protein